MLVAGHLQCCLGEGDYGRPERILPGSGDTTVFALTDHAAGTCNSCVPIDLKVYNQVVPPSSYMRQYGNSPAFILAQSMPNPNGLYLPSLAASRLQLLGSLLPHQFCPHLRIRS